MCSLSDHSDDAVVRAARQILRRMGTFYVVGCRKP